MARRSKGGGKRARPAGVVFASQVLRPRSDDANAFIRDPDSGPTTTSDDLADALGRDFVTSATTGEDAADEDLDQEVPEDIGGPFLETAASREYDPQPDASNPPDSTKEALPTAMGSGPPTPAYLENLGEREEPEQPTMSAQEAAKK